jgi:hypothetical protein
VSDAKADCEDNPVRSKPGKFAAQPGAEDAAKQKAIPAATRFIGSCAMADQCEDYTYDALGMEKDSCTSAQGKYATTPCPTDDFAGSCVQKDKVTRYSKSLVKKTGGLSIVEKMCNESGALGWGHFYPAPGTSTAVASANANANAGGGGGAAKGKATSSATPTSKPSTKPAGK